MFTRKGVRVNFLGDRLSPLLFPFSSPPKAPFNPFPSPSPSPIPITTPRKAGVQGPSRTIL